MPSARGEQALAIILEVYEGATQEVLWRNQLNVAELQPREMIQAIQDMGMVGLGGAAFPSHVKLSIPEGKTVDTLVINGCECEPYLSCDHRVLAEHRDQANCGAELAMRAVGARQGMIIDHEISYPGGYERLMIHDTLGKVVRSEEHTSELQSR